MGRHLLLPLAALAFCMATGAAPELLDAQPTRPTARTSAGRAKEAASPSSPPYNRSGSSGSIVRHTSDPGNQVAEGSAELAGVANATHIVVSQQRAGERAGKVEQAAARRRRLAETNQATGAAGPCAGVIEGSPDAKICCPKAKTAAKCTAATGVCEWFPGDTAAEKKEGEDQPAKCLEKEAPKGLSAGVIVLFACMLALGIIPIIKKCCLTTKEYKATVSLSPDSMELGDLGSSQARMQAIPSAT